MTFALTFDDIIKINCNWYDFHNKQQITVEILNFFSQHIEKQIKESNEPKSRMNPHMNLIFEKVKKVIV